MKRFFLTVLLTLAFLGDKALALNLTPLRFVVTGDGPQRVRYYFRDADKRLTFRIDPKMTVTGSADEAVFRFDDIPSATTRFSKSPAAPGLLFDEKGIPQYASLARAALPPDAQNVQLVEQVPDAIAINGWKSLKLVYTYQFFGLSYRRAITFLNFSPTEQYVFDVSSRQADYAHVDARSYRILNSLFEMPASKPAPES